MRLSKLKKVNYSSESYKSLLEVFEEFAQCQFRKDGRCCRYLGRKASLARANSIRD